MNTIQKDSTILLIGLLLLISSCENGIVSFVEGNWVSDIPFTINHVDLTISHDNRIYESAHFLTFSDASSDKIKMEFATMAEKAFAELMRDFNIARATDLGIADRSSKITIYNIKNLRTMQLAFPYGFLLYGKDSNTYANWPEAMKRRFYQEVKHETMHVMQFLFGVLPNAENPRHEPDKWFNEGIAEYVSGGFFIPITSKDELEEWLLDPYHINPITIQEWSDLPGTMERVGEYYPVFHLAVKYLLDSRGMDRDLLDVRKLLLLLAKDETDFAEAFELHMRISLSEYKETFYNRMEIYLN